MSYGFEIYDNEGTPALEDYPVMHVSDAVDLVPVSSLVSVNDQNYHVMFNGLQSGGWGNVLTLDRNFVSTSVNGGSLPLPLPGLTTPQDTLFVQLRSGQVLAWRNEGVIDFPDFPPMILPFIQGSVDRARVMSPVPPASPAGGYGMQVFNASGVKTFDSRAVNSGIAASFIVSQSQVSSILVNNTVVNLTLPKSMPNCWVGVPYLSAMRYQQTQPQYANYYHIEILQTSATNIRIRRSAGSDVFLGINPARDFIHDIVIYVARNF